MLRARVQTIIAMIRQSSTQQLTHLLRTCSPATTLHATRRLDTAVANTIFRILTAISIYLRSIVFL
jgi:hypothetical protein